MKFYQLIFIKKILKNKWMILIFIFFIPCITLPEIQKNDTYRDPFIPTTQDSEDPETIAALRQLQFAKSTDKLSLNFHNISTRKLLESLTNSKNFSVILSPNVQGSLSLHLENVTWQKALNAILLIENLAKYEDENILFIAPEREIAHLTQIKNLYDPLISELLPIDYAKASDIVNQLRNKNGELLSPRGSVAIDERTNALWVTDTRANLKQIRAFLTAVDKPEPQISISARIVNVDSDYTNQLGLEFSSTHRDSSTQNTDTQTNTNTALTNDDSGHFGIAIAKLGADRLLNVELSALEQEGHAWTISKPKLITANRQKASIESGQEIPYQEKTSSGGTNTSFKKAVLSLTVTPEITRNHHISLQLSVTQDKISQLSVNGVPAITTEQVTTQTDVSSGQTIVLGGIYETNETRANERVPFWSSIPVAGLLFKNKKTQTTHRELLIFVTPTIFQPYKD